MLFHQSRKNSVKSQKNKRVLKAGPTLRNLGRRAFVKEPERQICVWHLKEWETQIPFSGLGFQRLIDHCHFPIQKGFREVVIRERAMKTISFELQED